MPRPRKKVDKAMLQQLAALGLSNAEMAAVLDCSADTIERRYRKEMEIGRNMRNASLRRKQFEVAIKGNPTMLIWLGKQFLEQREPAQAVLLSGNPDIDTPIGVIVDL